MPSASDWPRTSTVTLAAYLARWTAACPAEFAPPTTNLPVLHRRGLGRSGAVEHAGADQPVERGDAEPPVGHAGGDDHGPAADLAPAADRHHALGPLGPQAGRRIPIYVVGTEIPGLRIGPHRKIRAAHPGREAQVVADLRAGPGLAADGLWF